MRINEISSLAYLHPKRVTYSPHDESLSCLKYYFQRFRTRNDDLLTVGMARLSDDVGGNVIRTYAIQYREAFLTRHLSPFLVLFLSSSLSFLVSRSAKVRNGYELFSLAAGNSPQLFQKSHKARSS